MLCSIGLVPTKHKSTGKEKQVQNDRSNRFRLGGKESDRGLQFWPRRELRVSFCVDDSSDKINSIDISFVVCFTFWPIDVHYVWRTKEDLGEDLATFSHVPYLSYDICWRTNEGKEKTWQYFTRTFSIIPSIIQSIHEICWRTNEDQERTWQQSYTYLSLLHRQRMNDNNYNYSYIETQFASAQHRTLQPSDIIFETNWSFQARISIHPSLSTFLPIYLSIYLGSQVPTPINETMLTPDTTASRTEKWNLSKLTVPAPIKVICKCQIPTTTNTKKNR